MLESYTNLNDSGNLANTFIKLIEFGYSLDQSEDNNFEKPNQNQ